MSLSTAKLISTDQVSDHINGLMTPLHDNGGVMAYWCCLHKTNFSSGSNILAMSDIHRWGGGSNLSSPPF